MLLIMQQKWHFLSIMSINFCKNISGVLGQGFLTFFLPFTPYQLLIIKFTPCFWFTH